MNFLSFCSVNELFFNDFPCLETRAYDNISCVCFLFSFFVLYWDNRLTRLTIDIPGREHGGDVDSVILASFREDRHIPPLMNTKTWSHISFILPI